MSQGMATFTPPHAAVSDNHTLLRRLALPSTELGWWSVALAAVFFALLTSITVWGTQSGHKGNSFFSDPLATLRLFAAAFSGAAAGTFAGAALLKRERCVLVLLVFVLLGVAILYWSLSQLGGL